MLQIGLVVNPVAGIGGKVGLKGSDGEAVKRALALGASMESGKKALVTMRELVGIKDQISVVTYPGSMGEDICKEAGMPCRVLGTTPDLRSGREETTSLDTKEAVKRFADEKVDLILFAGGDGTARDVLDALKPAKDQVTVLGIPTGCKIHSGVYAINPKTAAAAIRQIADDGISDTKEAEVMDINEELFRQGIVEAKLYGYLKIPSMERFVQNQKSGSGLTEADRIEDIAAGIVDRMEEDTLYIVGTGSTTAAIMKELDLPGTLLGVDLVYNKQLLASDCTEQEILSYLDRYDKVKLIVTVIGGQGYVFGRGNQQLSAKVILRVGKANIIVAAAKGKLLALKGQPLYVDTGDEEINAMLAGYIRVVCGYDEEMAVKVTD